MSAVVLSERPARLALSALHILEFESGYWRKKSDLPLTRPWWVEAAREIESKVTDSKEGRKSG